MWPTLLLVLLPILDSAHINFIIIIIEVRESSYAHRPESVAVVHVEVWRFWEMYDNTLWSFAAWSLNYVAVIEEVASLHSDHSPVSVNVEISINHFHT